MLLSGDVYVRSVVVSNKCLISGYISTGRDYYFFIYGLKILVLRTKRYVCLIVGECSQGKAA
jgi:hypothetical protein